MSVPNASAANGNVLPTDLLESAGFNLDTDPLDEEQLLGVHKLMRVAERDPYQLVVELLAAQRESRVVRQECERAKDAAVGIEQLLEKLLESPCRLYHLEEFRTESDGNYMAVCGVGNNTFREFAVHPDVDPEVLKTLQSWEYVRVHKEEAVVVGVWRDAPCLLDRAYGETAEFKAYFDRETHPLLVRASRDGLGESVVALAPSLQETELSAGTKLVLQQDNPRKAIAVIPAVPAECRFRVPINRITTRFEDLAGLDDIIETLVTDVLLRVVFTEIRDRFKLLPIKGFLLHSRKPGMGKSAFMRAFARWLYDYGHETELFDFEFYHLRPNETKSKWWGEDGRIVRDELFGAIRARQALPRARPLLQLIGIDEIDSFGKRAAAGGNTRSAAYSEGTEALLAEIDGILQEQDGDGPPAQILVGGLTNLIEKVDPAVKRKDRLGDAIFEMKDADAETAEAICAIYSKGASVAWYLDGAVQEDVDESVVRTRILRPAIANIFDTVVLRYFTDTQQEIEVAAGELMAAVNYKSAITSAKMKAALRTLRTIGVPAIGFDDVAEALVDEAVDAAKQMKADPDTLIRLLHIQVPVGRIEIVPRQELLKHRFVRLHSDSA